MSTDPNKIKEKIESQTAKESLQYSIEQWIESDEFRQSQSLLRNATNINVIELTKKALKLKDGKAVAVDIIAKELNGQLCAGFMTRVNGVDSPSNDDIKKMQMDATMNFIKSNNNNPIYLMYTEGCQSKGREFTNKLQEQVDEYQRQQTANQSSFLAQALQHPYLLSAGVGLLISAAAIISRYDFSGAIGAKSLDLFNRISFFASRNLKGNDLNQNVQIKMEQPY